MEKKTFIDGSLLASAQNAEQSLAKREISKIEESIPDGHPVKDMMDKIRSTGSEISDLPPGHPFLKELEAIKKRFESGQELSSEKKEKAKLKKAKRLDENRKKLDKIREEESLDDDHRQTASEVNEAVEGVLLEIRRLYGIISSCEEKLNNDVFSRTRILRMKRLLFASEKGLSECKISKVRMQ